MLELLQATGLQDHKPFEQVLSFPKRPALLITQLNMET